MRLVTGRYTLPQSLLTTDPFFQELKKHQVQDVVRVCEPTYKTDQLRNGGVNVTDLEFDDGTFPPNQVSQSFVRRHTKAVANKLNFHCQSATIGGNNWLRKCR